MQMLFGAAIVAILAASITACAAVARHQQIFAHEFVFQEQQKDPISGDWNVTFFVQDSKTPATFSFRLDGTSVTGTAYSEHTGPGTIRDGKWVDGKLSFTLDFKKHESIVVTGALRNGVLAGEFATEGFTDKWEATKR